MHLATKTLSGLLIAAALAVLPQSGPASAQDRGRQAERSHGGGGKPFVVRRQRESHARGHRVQRHRATPRRHHASPHRHHVAPRRHAVPHRSFRNHRHARPRTVIKVRPQYRRWHPGLPRTVIAVPSIAIGARIGWCHYHRFPTRGWKAHKIVRCHRHHPWNARGIAYVGIR